MRVTLQAGNFTVSYDGAHACSNLDYKFLLPAAKNVQVYASDLWYYIVMALYSYGPIQLWT